MSVRLVRRLGMTAGLLLLSGMVMSPARAASITYNFTGDVTSANPLLFSQFHTSQHMSGSITVNPTNTSTYNGLGIYNIQNSHITIGTYTATMGISGEVDITYTDKGDSFRAGVDAPMGNTVNSLAPNSFEIDLVESNRLTSVALPNPAPSVASFAYTRFDLNFGPEGSGIYVDGKLTSLTAVPLPPEITLFGMGLVALLGLRAFS